MGSPLKAPQPRVSPPVHQHRTWRHLQRAAIAAHRELAPVAQANFCSLMAPAASIAVWILQQAPDLTQRTRLCILVAHATEFEALDCGRWLQFIPWLLGRPTMTIEATIVGTALLFDAARDPSGATPLTGAELATRLRTHSWTAVKHLAPATLFQGTVKEWLETKRAATGAMEMPDICAVFSPSLFREFDPLLIDVGLLPLIRHQVPLAMFSASETMQLIDVYTLRAAGLAPRDPECWPNPWALPSRRADPDVAYGKMGWAAEFDSVPANATLDMAVMSGLGQALGYCGLGRTPDGTDGLLSLGETMSTAPRESDPPGESRDSGAVLHRLPHGVAVDSGNGHVYQLQGVTALLLEEVPAVPRSALERFPGNKDLLRRAIWAVGVHREFVAPFVRVVDD